LARLLNGADPDSLPTINVRNSFIVDWRQLKRWDISRETLPADATILYQEPTAWERYRRPILTFLLVLFILIALITFLLLERERRKKEEELSSAMLESLPGLALLVTKRGEILRSNQKDSRTSYGIELPALKVEPRLRYEDYLRKLVGADADLVQAHAIQDVISAQLGTAVVELPLREQDKWTEIRAIQLPGAKGGSLIVHLDITQRKSAELEQNNSREEIYHLNRVASLGHLAGSLAHELSQPLAAILSNAQAARRFMDRPDPDLQEVREALEDITRDDQRARAIIQEMRSMLKKESITRQAVDLNAIVRSLFQILKSEAQQKGVRMELLLVQGELMVMGDWGPLQQVLLNLMKNGMDAMQQIPVAQRCLTVKTELALGTQTAVISVVDNGPGISEKIKAKLFEPFVTTKEDGLGMGLSICQSIVNSLGGQIALKDASLAGSTFRVELPLITG
jgi:C4-dicarboxylate-specific signal transduction histidine kinase